MDTDENKMQDSGYKIEYSMSDSASNVTVDSRAKSSEEIVFVIAREQSDRGNLVAWKRLPRSLRALAMTTR